MPSVSELLEERRKQYEQDDPKRLLVEHRIFFIGLVLQEMSWDLFVQRLPEVTNKDNGRYIPIAVFQRGSYEAITVLKLTSRMNDRGTNSEGSIQFSKERIINLVTRALVEQATRGGNRE